MNPTDQQPTRVRYGVMAYLAALAFILYIDRICIAQAGTEMMKEFRLTATDWSFVLVAFQVAYAVFEPTTGHWGDRYGSRRVLIRIVIWWSTFTALTGAVPWFTPIGFGPVSMVEAPWFEEPAGSGNWYRYESYPRPQYVLCSSLLLLMLVRFLFGAGEAGALPNAARVISCWFPPGRRGPPQALISTCAQIGGAAAPALAALIINFFGWRWAFVVFGMLGFVWAWLFARWFHDDPTSHPGVNQAELQYILGDRVMPTPGTGHVEHIPWRLVVRNPNIWLLGLINACTSFFSYMLFSWFPTYLKRGRGLEEVASGWLGMLPFLFGATGVLLGGYVGDWLTVRTGSRRVALASMGTVGLWIAGVLVGSSIYADSPGVAVLLCSTGYFFSYLQLAGWWAAMADVGGRHLGALFGLCNMIGLAGGAGSQLFLGFYVDYMEAQGYVGREQWDAAFFLYGSILLLGGVLWLFINPRRPVIAADAAVWTKNRC
ncbi:MAG: MFS transporter [Gemmataceae bacterium]|nr:MFS transporter [Gemmataceae bacterium]